MRIFVKVKAGSRITKIEKPNPRLLETEEAKDEYYTVHVKEPPKEGKANDAVVRALATHFKVPRSSVTLLSGSVSKRKVFEITL